ncbi:hypothetical protein TVAG_438190 [Trichomonas vaginalis G3]|uniref:Uncharacterized protein n=1 Tax=Trichomonas vaginalis (strain ATCC PRA-98 / G3) TaxID=412133 RepID=A2EYL7_TRIV3|nr:hypothetical protein TVAGG3_0672530 [Trichomonas vaginalis G3]EAY02230.1 hypothetical protein TVAG_438190 [Trichomonas vaginalis G3]KAI5507301.1 hypothetical protein TVAGG3_0672530 [Trichomonas vaginalis G3]|eukprot:XP_001314568.1 hypothetical protein [Trichomonas vaginalis G3]
MILICLFFLFTDTKENGFTPPNNLDAIEDSKTHNLSQEKQNKKELKNFVSEISTKYQYDDSPSKSFYQNSFNSSVDFTNVDISICQCTFINISRINASGGPIFINSPERSVVLNSSIFRSCYSSTGASGGKINANSAKLFGNCFLSCHTNPTERVQPIDITCKDGYLYHLNIHKCGLSPDACGITAFQFKCSLNNFKVQHLNITNNFLNGAGCFIKHVDTKNCATIFVNLVQNVGINSSMVGEGLTWNSILTSKTNYINNTVKIMFHFEASSANQITYSVFKANNFKSFLSEMRTTIMHVIQCVFDISKENLSDCIFNLCTFNDTTATTLALSEIGNGECKMTPFNFTTTPTNSKFDTKTIIMISVASFVGFIIIVILAYCIYIRFSKRRSQMQELHFTDEYFKNFSYSII